MRWVDAVMWTYRVVVIVVRVKISIVMGRRNLGDIVQHRGNVVVVGAI